MDALRWFRNRCRETPCSLVHRAQQLRRIIDRSLLCAGGFYVDREDEVCDFTVLNGGITMRQVHAAAAVAALVTAAPVAAFYEFGIASIYGPNDPAAGLDQPVSGSTTPP